MLKAEKDTYKIYQVMQKKKLCQNKSFFIKNKNKCHSHYTGAFGSALTRTHSLFANPVTKIMDDENKNDAIKTLKRCNKRSVNKVIMSACVFSILEFPHWAEHRMNVCDWCEQPRRHIVSHSTGTIHSFGLGQISFRHEYGWTVVAKKKAAVHTKFIRRHSGARWSVKKLS